MLIGYARVSTQDQNLALQYDALTSRLPFAVFLSVRLSLIRR